MKSNHLSSTSTPARSADGDGFGMSPLRATSSGWIATYDDDGSKYYYNSTTGEARWEVPSGNTPAGSGENASQYSRSVDPSMLPGGGQQSARSQASVRSTGTWEKELDPATNHSYYINMKTGVSQWDTPANLKAKQLASGNTPGNKSVRTEATNATAANWHKEFDDNTNANYYYNAKTGDSQWDTPANLKAKQLASGNTPGNKSVRTEATSANATVANWHKEFDDNTNANYYYNAKTGNSQWNTPTRSMNSWHQEFDENADNKYYYNSKTGESQWDTPAKLKERQQMQQNQVQLQSQQQYQQQEYSSNYNVSPLSQQISPTRRREGEEAPLSEAISELVEDETVTLAKKFERLKERSRVINRFGDTSGVIWLEWEGLGGMGPRFFSIEDEAGGQWARPEKASNTAFQMSEQSVGANEHEFGNKLLRKWKSVSQTSNEEVKKRQFQKKVNDAIASREDGGSVGSSSAINEKASTNKKVVDKSMFSDNIGSSTINSRDPKRPASAVGTHASSDKSSSNFNSRDVEGGESPTKSDPQYSKYYMKAIYQDIIDRDRNVEIQFEKEKDRLRLEKEELMLMGTGEKKSVRSQILNDNNKTKGKIGKSNSSSMNNSKGGRLVIDTNFNVAVKSDSDSDSDESYMPDPKLKEEEVSKDINYNILYSRAVIMKQIWPWTCLVDLLTDTIFYRNEQEDSFQKAIPSVFQESGSVSNNKNSNRSSSSGGNNNSNNSNNSNNNSSSNKNSSSSSNSSSNNNNPNPNVKSSGNPLKLLNEFKEEMYYRTVKSAFDKDIAVKVTSTAEDRNLPNHSHLDMGNIVSAIKGERSPVDRDLLESSALPFEQATFTISSSKRPTSAKVKISKPSKKNADNKSLFSKSNTPNLFINKYKAPNIRLSASTPPLPLKVPKTSGTLLTSHINDGKELLTRLRSITDAEFHSLLLTPVVNNASIQQYDSGNLLSTSNYHGQSLIDLLQNKKVVLTVNGRKISKAQRQIILQKEFERDEKQRLLEKQIIAQQMKSCRDLTTYAIELLDIEANSEFEKEINRRHMLESIVTQRDYLKFPFTIRDAKSFSTVPIHLLCPNILTNLDIEKLESNQDGFTTVKISIDDWNVFNTSNLSLETPSILYQCKHSKKTQSGRPFDLRLKLDRNPIMKESWQEYEFLMPTVKKHLYAKKLHLLTDRFGGLLFYCPRRDEYSSDGSMKRTLLRKNFILDTKTSIDNAENGLLVYVKPKLNGSNSNSKFYGFAHISSWSKYLESNSYYWKTIQEDLWNVVMKDVQSSEKNLEEKSSIIAAEKLEPQHNIEEFANYSKTLQNIRMSITKAAEQMGVPINNINNNINNNNNNNNNDNTRMMQSMDISFNVFPDDSFNRDTHLGDNQGNQVNDKFMKNIDDSFLKFQNAENRASRSDFHKTIAPSNNLSHFLAGSISNISLGVGHNNNIINNSNINNATKALSSDKIDESSEKFEDLSLSYEGLMHPRFRIQYQELINLVKTNNNDPVPIVQLMVFLLERNLGIESLFVYQRALEFISLRSQRVLDDVLSHILAMKLSAKFYGERQSVVSVQTLLKLCPESASLSAHLARLFYDLKHKKMAETIYIGALVVEPLNPHSLLGYSLMLLEKGNFMSSLRYLSRIEEDSMYFSFSRLLIAWVQEFLKKDDETVLSTYKVILNHSQPIANVNAKALSSLGHYFHIRGDFDKAERYYRRSLKVDPKNMQSSLLLAALLTTNPVISPPTKENSSAAESPTNVNNNSNSSSSSSNSDDNVTAASKAKELCGSDEEIDALYRRGCLCSQLGDNDKWIGSLGYAEFIISHLGDTSRAQTYFESASKDSFSFSIWATIALAHFFQYTRDAISNGMRILQGLLRSRMNIMDSLEESEPLSDELANVVKDERVLRQKLEETSIILCAMAYCALDRSNEVEALRFANQALSIDDKLVAAHRLLGIIHYKDKIGNKTDVAKIHFDKSIQFMNYNNPFCLRSYSIYLAKEKRNDEAYQYMEAAVKARPHCTLSVRALAMMTYLFKSSPDDALILLQRALDLSAGVDMDSLRLQGQIYLEVGDHIRARRCFQNVLKVTPLDSIAMANLAISLSALGFESAYGDLDNKTPSECYLTYNKKLQNKSYKNLLVSEDPFELFVAAININISGSFLNVNPVNESDYSLVNSEVLFLFGMYLLQRGSIGNLNEAKLYFQRAVKHIEKPTHPIALYMIGWISELCGDLRTAEQYYCTSLQFEPIEPLVFLRLSRVASDTRFYINTLLEKVEKNDLIKRQKMMKNSKSRNLSSKILSSLEIAYYGLNSSAMKYLSSDELSDDETDINGLSTLRLRMNLHDRVSKLADLCRDKKGDEVRNLYCPRRFVLIDPAWIDRLFYSFSVCDDWSHLLKSSKSFRDKK